MTDLVERERAFYDQAWQGPGPGIIAGELFPIPAVPSLRGKRVLICSTGWGHHAVRAARAGAEVYAFDISPVAVENTLRTAAQNQVTVCAQVMSFEALLYPDNHFDVIFGSAILHHVDCARVAREIYRCLRPGGVAYFLENSDRNPVLRWARRLIFGVPGKNQRQRMLFFRREGTADEYPLTEAEVEHFRTTFGDGFRLIFHEFVFFQMLYTFAFRWPWVGRLTRALDRLTGRAFPGLMKYSYGQHLWMMKPPPAPDSR